LGIQTPRKKERKKMQNFLLLRTIRVRHGSQLLGKVGGVAAFSY